MMDQDQRHALWQNMCDIQLDAGFLELKRGLLSKLREKIGYPDKDTKQIKTLLNRADHIFRVCIYGESLET